MLKNVIFDIGNVLMKFDALNYGAVYFQDKEKAKLLQNAIDSFHLWDKCDMGDRDVEEIIEEFAASVVGHEAMAREAAYASLDYVLYADYAIPWIKELQKAGYKVYFLSNYNKFLAEKRPDILDFIPYMDGGVFSYDVHLLKPNREIYEVLLNKYSLDPQECVFLDDRVANIQGAEQLGIKGIIVKNYDQARQDLKKLLNY